MTEQKKLIQRLDFSTLPKDWGLVGLSVDWQGEPLLLFERGRAEKPKLGMTAEEISNSPWNVLPVHSHHLLHWNGSGFDETVFHVPEMGYLYHAQPFGDGWLLGEARGGNAQFFDRTGNRVLHKLDLGDASEHIQTTETGQIWVAYFDEGVFGNGIGGEGLVCFDFKGQALFKYAEFANKLNLPAIDDCYTLNIDCDNNVWICYYSDFPLVCLKDFELAGIWHEWGPTSGLAVRGEMVLRFPAYRENHLLTRTFTDPKETIWELVTPEGKPLALLANKHEDTYRTRFKCRARGGRLYIWNDSMLYELP
jgi:hypothetical protein